MAAMRPGIVALTLGTSGVVFTATDAPHIDPDARLQSFCHAAPRRWHVMGVMLSAGGSLRWYRDTLAPGASYESLLAPAAEAPAGSDSLLFLPYLAGERTPHADPLARGAFVGLTLRHDQRHMTRALLEGVAFGLRDILELIKAAGLAEPTTVRVSGGGATSPLWRQIVADVLGIEVATVDATEGAACGAALLAGVGAGVWDSVDAACESTVSLSETTEPQGANAATYDESYQRYRELYHSLKETFHQSGA
jgi:xylulokinase